MVSHIPDSAILGSHIPDSAILGSYIPDSAILGSYGIFRTLQYSWGLTFRTLRSPRRLRRPRYRGARADDARHSPSLPGRPAGTEHRNI